MMTPRMNIKVDKKIDKKSTRILNLSLCSSVLFLLGIPFPLASLFCTIEPWVAASLGVVGWGIVGASVIPEAVIDFMLLCSGEKRPFSHGRYGRSPMLLHWLQSIVFFCAVVFAGLHHKRSRDYSYLSTGDTHDFFKDKYYLLTSSDLWLASSYLFVISGLLASYLTRCAICCRCGRKPETQGGLCNFVKVGNCIYLGSSISYFGAYCSSCDMDTCIFRQILLIGSHCGFLAAAICWVIADFQQLWFNHDLADEEDTDESEDTMESL